MPVPLGNVDAADPAAAPITLWTEEPEANTPPWWFVAALMATWLFIILSIDEAIHYLFAWLF